MPAIDFAGTGRTVPWATWYEHTTAFGNKENIFASRFDNTGGANQNKWIFGGQNRNPAAGGPPIPSLNIHPGQDGENPSVAGGSATDPTKPGPWVTWQEIGANAPGTGMDQIFVDKPIGPGSTNCNGVTPAAVDPAAAPIGGFCWQQVGVERLGADPSLNVDRTRNGVEPDIAFTGANDSVPWVVWYEKDNSGAGLHDNEMVFAAKGVAPGAPTGTVDGGFNWVTVGTGGQGVLDDSAGGGACGASQAAEALCSINKDANADAEDPRVAAGTMAPGAAATVPWVVWDEKLGGTSQIFVARLVGAGAAAHFATANNGAPISVTANPSTRPDITFSGGTPYVSWRENTGGGVDKAFYGHFVDPANPTFVPDNTPVDITPSAQADVRNPTSSSCIATPVNADGVACQGGTVGTPLFLFTNGSGPRKLFANAYQTDAPQTDAPSGVGVNAATVSGRVNPQGAAVRVAFQFGTTTAYGQSSTPQTFPPANSPISFSAGLTGLPAGTTVHYRAVVSTDFGTVAGADQTLVTQPPTPTITGLAQSHKTWREGARLATLARTKPKKRPVGTTFSFRLDTPGRVQLAFTQRVRGRKVSGRCVRPTNGNKRRHACTRTVVAGSLAFSDHAGLNRVHFEGRLSRKRRLKPGPYTLVVTAANTLGRKSATRTISFTIVRR